MKSESIYESCTLEAISEFAKRNYKTYVEHYQARDLVPMPFEEFVKNYSS